MSKHKGSCHCGAVKFSFEGDLSEPVMECNCSHCARKGFLLKFVPADAFTLETPDAELTEYRFNHKQIQHLFCPTCGIQAFGRGKDPSSGADVVAVNVRCVESVDLDALARQQVDGKSF